MRFALLLVSLVCACGGGGSSPPALAGEPFQVMVILEEADEGEAEDIRKEIGGVTVEQLGSSAIFLLTLDGTVPLSEVLHDLDDDARVLVSEPDYTAESPEGDPADVPVLGGDVVASIPVQPELVALALQGAQAVSTGAGVVVGVVDTGIDPAHPALAGHVLPNGFDFIGQDFDPRDVRNLRDDDGDGVIDEQYGHGTFVASLVLAVAPDAMILPVRVLDAEGFGTSSTVAAGIIWAVDAGADVINLSADLPDAPEMIREAIRYARDRGALVVAAAGNVGGTDIAFPARSSDVLGVTAVDGTLRKPAFASSGSAVSLVAPGVSVLGAMPFDLSPSGTARWSGTSFATPIVAGAAALVRAASPGLSPSAVRQRLMDTAMSVDAMNPAFAGQLGKGLIQPLAALQ
ncbi:MAG TPA: S8 family serine peptidase [Planctomycetota bacterium]|nr:S8 family serine peptidase [Planctomycetota bacterium]